MLQKNAPNEAVTGKPDVQVVSGKSVQSGVNALAREGYRLQLIREDIAVMVRKRGIATPTSYCWWSGISNSEEEWSQLQTQDAIYRMTSPDSEKGAERALVFEQPFVPQAKRSAVKASTWQAVRAKNGSPAMIGASEAG